MADLNGLSSGRVQPSLLPVLAEGLDLTRTIPGRALGVYKAADAASFAAGQVLSRDSNGNMVLCTGANPAGLAKWNKVSSLNGIAVDEPIVLTGTNNIPLKHANVAAVKVTNLAGVAYTVTTDYTVNATNGTVARVALGGIASGETVLVSYRFAATNNDLDFNGRNFFNLIDDTALAQGRIALIQGLSTIFTAAYDTSQVYAVNDAIKCGSDGYPTKTGGGAVIGSVIQVPTASDPYLGFSLSLTV